MIRKNKAAKNLTGLFCLPTSTKYHAHERERSGAFIAGQVAFFLAATQSVDDGGYPPLVVLTAFEGDLDLQIGDLPDTQHAEVRKNLPPRQVVGIVYADGSIEGDVPAKGVGTPHWEFVSVNSEGAASMAVINETKARIEANRKAREEQKQAARDAKKGAKTAAAA